jgi:hypothetical protein
MSQSPGEGLENFHSIFACFRDMHGFLLPRVLQRTVMPVLRRPFEVKCAAAFSAAGSNLKPYDPLCSVPWGADQLQGTFRNRHSHPQSPDEDRCYLAKRRRYRNSACMALLFLLASVFA